MGLVDITFGHRLRFNSAAGLALGIAVDDTIHLLTEYRRQRSAGMSVSNSMKTATLVKGSAVLSSSLILSIGFGISGLSNFVPIMHFGLLTGLIMLTAVVGDLVFLPALINMKKSNAAAPISGLNISTT